MTSLENHWINPEYYKNDWPKLASFSECILSVLKPSFSNNCWKVPDKEFYDVYKQSKILFYTSVWIEQNKKIWEQISYNYFPHPLYLDKQLLAITFSNSEIVPENIRWKSLWMSNIHLPKWDKLQENFHGYNYVSPWNLKNLWWDNIFSNVTNWVSKKTWDIFWLWINVEEFNASMKKSIETILNPNIIKPETDKLLLWFEYFWIIPTFDEFKSIWDFLPWTFEEKLLILNIPLNWYRLDVWWIRFDYVWELIYCYWDDETKWPKDIQDKINKFKKQNLYHWIERIAMFWTKKTFRQKAFVEKTFMIETFVLDADKKTYNVSDMENYWFASMRTFVA